MYDCPPVKCAWLSDVLHLVAWTSIPAELLVERPLRPSKSRDNLNISTWPHPPTMIPLSDSPSSTRSLSRGTIMPSPTLCSSPSPIKRNSYYNFVRQQSPTFAKATITNCGRVYTFGAPSPPTVTPPPRVLPLFQGSGITRVDAVLGPKAGIGGSPWRVPPHPTTTDSLPGQTRLKPHAGRVARMAVKYITGFSVLFVRKFGTETDC